jgi:hypothetical protein
MDMKLKTVKKAVLTGETEDKGLILEFQKRVLTVLKNRGILSPEQLNKGLTLLRERTP